MLLSTLKGIQAFTFLCTFVPRSEKSTDGTVIPVELLFRGTFAAVELSFLWSERSMNFRSLELSFLWNLRSRTFVP